MPKKRRLGSAGCPSERRMKFNDGSGEIVVARDRLKGVLLDLLVSDEDSSSSQDEAPASVVKPSVQIQTKENVLKPNLLRRRKRKSGPDLELAFQHTFVMKLFDRSVDLAQFQEETPLYPICRAWIANQPLVPQPYPPPESPGIKNEYDDMFDFGGEVRDTYRMPAPACPPWHSRIPPLSPPVLKGVSLEYNSDKLPSANELLEEHQVRWKNCRRKWIESARNNEQRFHASGVILSNMYKRSQGL